MGRQRGRHKYTTRSILVAINTFHVLEVIALVYAIYYWRPSRVLYALLYGHRIPVLFVASIGTPIAWLFQALAVLLSMNSPIQDYKPPPRSRRAQHTSTLQMGK